MKNAVFVFCTAIIFFGCTNAYFRMPPEDKATFDAYFKWLEPSERYGYMFKETSEERAAYLKTLNLCERVHKQDNEDLVIQYHTNTGSGVGDRVRRECFIKENPNIGQSVREAIEKGDDLFPGMTTADAIALIGAPKRINRTVSMNGSGHKSEQWVYTFRTLYFEDGKLTSMQD